jgi:hypothetical protein
MTSCAPLRGIALSEARQLNGYRVRLRLVEEYDVALLAESPDDAKARAEADLRNRSGASDLFRSTHVVDPWLRLIAAMNRWACALRDFWDWRLASRRERP